MRSMVSVAFFFAEVMCPGNHWIAIFAVSQVRGADSTLIALLKPFSLVWGVVCSNKMSCRMGHRRQQDAGNRLRMPESL
jgi:hypothetical protein